MRGDRLKNTIRKYINNKHITIFIFLILCLLVSVVWHNRHKTMSFNHDKWISALENESWSDRKKMAQDLIDKKTLIGKSKNDIIEMLGTSESLSDVASNEIYYATEVDYGWDIDPVRLEYLIISFDSQERVISACRKITLNRK